MPRSKEELIFSANSLQAFADCERRFELNYLDELKWPAVETEPVLKSEHFLADGRRFHEMIHQDLLGIPVMEPSLVDEPELAAWWQNYRDHDPIQTYGQQYPEKTLVSSLKDRLLVATYDLFVVTEEGKVTIYDWKTWRKPHAFQWVKQQMQSRIYPLVIYQERASIAGAENLQFEDIKMQYWYANFPEESVSFQYSEDQYLADKAVLELIIDRIDSLPAGQFELTSELAKCTYCPFRSYCDRGSVAGSIEEHDVGDSTGGDSLFGNLDDYESIAF